jgi:carboxymethylenebutenolidase
MLSFVSGGKTIRTEWFDAAGSGKRPAVIILHGSGGMESTGGFQRQLADCLMRAGFTAVVVHYMDRNGIKYATTAQMGAHFGQWLSTTKEAISFVAKQPNVDGARISLMGHSLGAQLSLHTAAADPRVHSVVDMAGSFVLPTKAITRMPPVLILHGTKDTTVSLTRERALVSVLKRVGAKYEEHLFEGGDHGFSTVYMEDLCDLSIKFLRK